MSRPEIVAVANNEYLHLSKKCPKCRRELGPHSKMCAKCGLSVWKIGGMDVGTRSGIKPSIADVRAFVSGDRPRLIGVDSVLWFPADSKHPPQTNPTIFTHSANRAKSGKPDRYAPRPLSHETRLSPWLLRTLSSAALAWWQFFGGR